MIGRAAALAVVLAAACHDGTPAAPPDACPTYTAGITEPIDGATDLPPTVPIDFRWWYLPDVPPDAYMTITKANGGDGQYGTIVATGTGGFSMSSTEQEMTAFTIEVGWRCDGVAVALATSHFTTAGVP